MEIHLSNSAVELKWVFKMKIPFLEWRVKLPFYKSVEIELGLQENGVEQRQARECKITMGALKCWLNKNNPKKSDPMKPFQKRRRGHIKMQTKELTQKMPKEGKQMDPAQSSTNQEIFFTAAPFSLQYRC